MRALISILLASFSISVCAAKDPIAWSLNRSFVDPLLVGRSDTITYTLRNQLPFALKKPLSIQKLASSATEFSYADACSGQILARNGSCEIKVTLTATSTGRKTLELIVGGYDKNQVVLPLQVTNATGATPPANHLTLTSNLSQALPNSLEVGQSGQYIMTFTNPSQTQTATNLQANLSQSLGTPTYTSTCSATLSPKASCQITGNYTPTAPTPTVQSVTASITYAEGGPITLSTATTVNAAGTNVSGFWVGSHYLPAVMQGGGTGSLELIFMNHGPGNANFTAATITVTQGGASATLSNIVNGCVLNNLPENAGCQISADFSSDTVVTDTPVTVTATLTYNMVSGGGSQQAFLTTSTTLVPSLSTSRQLTLVNHCSFPVWFSLNGGQLANSPSCSSDTDCNALGTGLACSALTHKCFWKNYGPDVPGVTPYKLDASTGTKTVTIPLTTADSTIQWSGNISASTVCDGSSSCLQASCSNQGGATACAPGQGFSPPATQAEITMLKNGADSYDVEVINGFHIPVSMAAGPYVTPDNYNCGAAGQYASGNGFGACNWEGATPNLQGYYWVKSLGSNCNLNAPSCPSGQLCGISSTYQTVCGSFLGYWTSDQLCSVPALPTGLRNYFSCDTTLTSLDTHNLGFPSNATLYSLMACPVPKGDTHSLNNSCYLSYSGVPSSGYLNCCGCIDWWTIPGIGANTSSQSCTPAGHTAAQTDPVWNSYVQPGIQWLKKACPSAYTYPFDDKTSSFTCTNNLAAGANSVGYTITFCEGNSGLPAGITEGRN